MPSHDLHIAFRNPKKTPWSGRSTRKSSAKNMPLKKSPDAPNGSSTSHALLSDLIPLLHRLAETRPIVLHAIHLWVIRALAHPSAGGSHEAPKSKPWVWKRTRPRSDTR